jgi:long-chain fatty acid transport protein
MAYDNGSAAVMNNPATLGLMPDGDRLDVALGFLGPHIKSEMPGMPDAESSADAFWMPALGWVRKSGQFAYGLAVFSQGGMGTKYDANSFLAAGSGKEVESKLGVGRAIIPLVYNVTPDLTIGGSLDYVWASLDLEMAASVQQLSGLITGGGGPLFTNLGLLPPTSWARIDFTSGGDFNGAATGTGFAGKIGTTYKINPAVTVGATYHSKTYLQDLETKSNGAELSAQFAGPSIPGKITVHDFQWPETYAVGAAWNASKDLMVVFDIKRINWSDVMKSFKMSFEGGASIINFALPQNWHNQTVYELGAGYKLSEPLTVRAGVNISSNPIPDTYLNPLFPATIKNHYMVGAGYMVTKASSVDASFTYAPEVKATNAQGITVTHYQTNAQVMYSYRF